jgi:hypothetical protein
MANLKLKETADSSYSSGLAANPADILPNIGFIIPFAGPSTAIPSGWVLCNGLNGTPDLRSKFIAGSTTAGALSPDHDHTLTHAVGTVDSTTPGNHASVFNVAATIANNTSGHSHNALTAVRFGSAQINDGQNANRVTGNQANVIQNDHIHPTNPLFSSNTANTNAETPAHAHSLNSATAGASVWSANHNHPKTASSSTTISTTKLNPAQYLVHFIMKVA